MKAIILLFVALGFMAVRGDSPAVAPEFSVSANEKVWSIPKENAPLDEKEPQIVEKLSMTVKNNLPEKKIFTSFQTLVPFVESANGARVSFSARGRDHTRLPDVSEFITVEPGQSGTLSAQVLLCKLVSGYTLWYENPTGDVYSYTLSAGTYRVGFHYELPSNFLDGFNDPKREAYHQPWDDVELIWRGSADSSTAAIKIKST